MKLQTPSGSRTGRSGRVRHTSRLTTLLFVVLLSFPVSADVCGDYRAAIVRLEMAEAELATAVAAKDTSGTFVEGLSDPILGPPIMAAHRARSDLQDAARALQSVIDLRLSDKAGRVAFAVKPFLSIDEGLSDAYARIFWDTTEGKAARRMLLDAMEQAERAYHLALRFACPD